MIESKHIVVVAGLLVVGGLWYFGARYFRTEAPPVVEVADADALPFVQCRVKIGEESVEWANIQLLDPTNEKREVVGIYDDERGIYRFSTRDGAGEQGGVPEGLYAVIIKPGRRTRVSIPEKYGDPETSELTALILDEPNDLSTFELTP